MLNVSRHGGTKNKYVREFNHLTTQLFNHLTRSEVTSFSAMLLLCPLSPDVLHNKK